ncbi:MAG: CvpA family protein [Alphaproteobacteria bacterium]|nr:CvpA family protein [Alphaproteobacteria bacterium]
MNAIDIGIVVIVLVSSLFGASKGITREFFGLISWGGSGTGTYLLFPFARQIARQQITNQLVADGAAVLILFVVFLILFSLISHFFSSMVRNSALGGIDRSLGFGFGIVRGVALACILELLMGCFVPRADQPELVKSSRFSSLLYQGSDALFQIMPNYVQEFILQQKDKNSNEQKESPAEAALSKVTDKAILALIQEPVGKTVETLPLALPSPQHPSSKVKTREEKIVDTQKAAEDLANLKPKGIDNPNPTTTYSKKQKQEMDRLLQQEEID